MQSGLGLVVAVAVASGCSPATGSPTTPPASGDPGPTEPESTEPEPEPTTPEPEPPRLHFVTEGDTTHVYVALELRAFDLPTSESFMQRELAYRFSDGGQFEIAVRPELVPAQAPQCSDGLIVRMPWTNPELPGAETAVERKRDLFSRLTEVRQERRESQPVVLQLDPYVEIGEGEPPEVSLTQCTLFFRYDPETYAYIDHLPAQADAP